MDLADRGSRERPPFLSASRPQLGVELVQLGDSKAVERDVARAGSMYRLMVLS